MSGGRIVPYHSGGLVARPVGLGVALRILGAQHFGCSMLAAWHLGCWVAAEQDFGWSKVAAAQAAARRPAASLAGWRGEGWLRKWKGFLVAMAAEEQGACARRVGGGG